MPTMTEPVVEHRTTDELETYRDHIRLAPDDVGTVELIVSRPGAGERTIHDEAELDLAAGLVGDSWSTRPSRRGPDPESQLNMMSARVISAIAGDDKRNWAPAGDQLYVDLDISRDNLPTGARLRLGNTAVIEITSKPHNGCAKFDRRFGALARAWVNTPEGKEMRMRGVCAKVVVPGTVRAGDKVVKVVNLFR